MAGSAHSRRDSPTRNNRIPASKPLDESTLSLLNRAQTGDSQALERLCIRYLPRLSRWATGRLPASARSTVETADLVQDTLLSVIRRLGGIQPRHAGQFPAYLRTAILNRLRDEVRKAAIRLPGAPLDGTEVDPAPSPLEEAIGRDLAERYESAFKRLNDDHRAALFLRIELEMSHEDIADALAKPSADAARMTINRALIRLVREMQGEKQYQ
jgi:RNA polymerase sigma factor (sigma-70 family)